jgi:branched-chain amino acid transport system substrate-binding protein
MRTRWTKLAVIATVILATALLVISCGPQEQEVIKIGVAGAHSGDLASYGLPTVNAAELVVEQANENGGVLGRQVQLVVEDDQCLPEVAANTAAKLVGEEVVAVIGHICSGATRAALGTYLESEIVAISPSATNPPLTKSGEYPNFFRTIAPDDAQGQLQAEYVVNELGFDRFAVLHDKGDYGKGLAEFARSFLQEGGGDVEIALFEGITAGAVDYSAIINRIDAANVDAVIFGGYHPEASKLVGQMRQQGMDVAFISGDGVKDDTFIQVAGEDSEGVYATGAIDTTQNPIAIEATEAHQEKYGSDPGPFFLNGYAAAQAILNAIEEAGTTDYEEVTAALREQIVETPLGRISFDERGDAVGVGFSMYQVQDGRYVELD